MTIALQWRLLGADVRDSLLHWPFWVHLAWQDVKGQYRRSFLGSSWVAINTALFTLAFGWLGARLFGHDAHSYIPYFCLGNVFFGLLTNTLNDGCRTYMDAASFLKQAAYPKLAFVLRVVLRNLLLLAHQVPLLLAVLLYGDLLGSSLWGWWLLGLLMVVCTVVLAAAWLAVVCARFRDVPMMVSSVLQIAFFVTPVMWQAKHLGVGASEWIIHLNPLAACLALLRDPLLGTPAPAWAWLNAAATALVFLVLCCLTYVRARKKITYWL